ncbi:hypothetical protein [Streptomyces sp. NPDC050560]
MAAEDTELDNGLDLDVDEYDEFSTLGLKLPCGCGPASNIQCSNPLCA